MKYDILVQTFIFYTLKFVCRYFSWLENNICQKKNPALLAQKLVKKKLSKSVSGYSMTKKKGKKVAWTTKPLGGRG